MTSKCNQSTPYSSNALHSDSKFEKSQERIEGAIIDSNVSFFGSFILIIFNIYKLELKFIYDKYS